MCTILVTDFFESVNYKDNSVRLAYFAALRKDCVRRLHWMLAGLTSPTLGLLKAKCFTEITLPASTSLCCRYYFCCAHCQLIPPMALMQACLLSWPALWFMWLQPEKKNTNGTINEKPETKSELMWIEINLHIFFPYKWNPIIENWMVHKGHHLSHF